MIKSPEGVISQTAGPSGPEHASGRTSKKLFTASDYVVASAHPLASRAGAAVIERGGNAVDAAIAVQAVLGLVEPHSSSLAGGGYALVFDAATGRTTAYDGRETAPGKIVPGVFTYSEGEASSPEVMSGLAGSIGVPGLPALLELIHLQHGRKRWAELFEEAIHLSTAGFEIGHRLAVQIAAEKDNIRQHDARRYLLSADGAPRTRGEKIWNPEYGAFLERFSAQGRAYVYGGAFSKDFCDTLREAADPSSLMEPYDFSCYRARKTEVLQGTYRGHRVFGCGGSTAGGVMVLQMLGLMEQFPADMRGPTSVAALHMQLQASRLAFADRSEYLADPDFAIFDKRLLLKENYLHKRASQIDIAKDMGKAIAGRPDGLARSLFGSYPDRNNASTTHFSIVDPIGNAVSMTTSIGLSFGSKRMVHGMFLNGQLVAFSPAHSTRNAKPAANRAEPNKRPLSSMAPTLLFDPAGLLKGITGSPGSSAIVGYTVKTISGLIDFHLDPQACCDLPNAINRNGLTELEKDSEAATHSDALSHMGHEIVLNDQTSGVHMISRSHGGWMAGCDPRRDGQACGQ